MLRCGRFDDRRPLKTVIWSVGPEPSQHGYHPAALLQLNGGSNYEDTARNMSTFDKPKILSASLLPSEACAKSTEVTPIQDAIRDPAIAVMKFLPRGPWRPLQESSIAFVVLVQGRLI